MWRWYKRKHKVDYLSKKMDLNPEQQESLKTYFAQLKETRQEMRAMSSGLLAEVRQELREEEKDPEQLRTKLQEIYTQKKERVDGMVSNFIDQLSDFYESLNPQQRLQLADFPMRGRRHHRHCSR